MPIQTNEGLYSFLKSSGNSSASLVHLHDPFKLSSFENSPIRGVLLFLISAGYLVVWSVVWWRNNSSLKDPVVSQNTP